MEENFYIFPEQSELLGEETQIYFNYDTSNILNGVIVRDDKESPFVSIIQLENDRYVLGSECKRLSKISPVFGIPRHSRWPKERDNHLLLNPKCVVCGAKNSIRNPLTVHHKKPFHLFPELELDHSNFRTVCKNHHLWVGHLGSWLSWNEDFDLDADYWLKKILSRP